MPSRSRVNAVLGAIAIDVPVGYGQIGHGRPFGLPQGGDREARGHILDVHLRHQRVARLEPLACRSPQALAPCAYPASAAARSKS